MLRNNFKHQCNYFADTPHTSKPGSNIPNRHSVIPTFPCCVQLPLDHLPVFWTRDGENPC